MGLACTVDVTQPATVRAMVDAAKERFGRIDVLVNNARWTGLRPTPVAEISDEDWQRTIDVNLTGAFNCVRAVVPTMIEQKSGRIIMMSSATVTLPPARPYVHYITTKAALIGMARSLARELGPHYITVNSVLPGSVETGVARPHLSAEQRKAQATKSQSIPEMLESGDITGAVAFLASEESRHHRAIADGRRRAQLPVTMTIGSGRGFL